MKRILYVLPGVLLVPTIGLAGDIVTDGKLKSTLPSGAPLEVASADMVANLNADLVDGVEGTDICTNASNIAVNASAIADNTSRIAALEGAAFIDFPPYAPVGGTKEYQEATSVPVACNIVRQDITVVDDATDSDIHITETYTNGFIDCAIFDTDYKLTGTTLSVVAYRDHTMATAITYDTPGEVLNDAMVIGKTFGYASTNVTNPSQVAMQTSTVLAIEPVNVPAGSFTDCLKVRSELKSNFVMQNYEGVSWHCPGVGEVKRVYYDANADIYVTRRLTSIY